MFQRAIRGPSLSVLLLLALAISIAPAGGSSRSLSAAAPLMESGAWDSSGPRVGGAYALAVSPDFARDGIAFSGEWLTSFRSTESGVGIARSTDGGQNWSISDAGTEEIDYSSAVHDFSFSPAFGSDRTVFAATWGGLFKSTDRGSTWQWLEGAYSGPPGGSLRIAAAPDYASSGVVLAGDWGGLLLSRDGGASWTRNSEINASAGIAYSPAFAADSTAFSAGGKGVFRTTDAGMTWTRTISTPVSALAISPEYNSDRTLFAGGDFFLRSEDGGSTWITDTIAADAQRISALAVSPAFAQDHTLFAGTSQGLYTSVDAGISWQPLSAYAGDAVRSLAISPQWPEHRVLLVGSGAGVYRMLSDDPGSEDVRRAASGFAPGDASPLAWSAQDDLLLTATRNHGLYGSRDGGQSWEPMGLQGGYGYYSFSDVAISPNYAADQTLFAAWASGTGIGGSVYRSTDGGESWDNVYNTDYVGDLALSPQYGSEPVIYATSQEKGLFRSSDGGESWEPVGTWPDGLSMGTTLEVALAPDYPADSTLFVGGGKGFWYLPVGSETWQPAASGLTSKHYITSLQVSPAFADDHTLLAVAHWSEPIGTMHDGLFRSSNGGRDWSLSTTGLPAVPLADVAFSPGFEEDQTAYLSTVRGEVYRSDDGGSSWIRAGEVPGAPGLRQIVVQDPGHVFVASEEGVWRYATLLYDLVVDGSMEAGSGWTFPATMQTAAYSEDQAYDGQRSALVGIVEGSNVASYSSLYQDLALPADLYEARLTFHLFPRSSDAAVALQQSVWPPNQVQASAASDAQFVMVLDPQNNNILQTLTWELSDTREWERHTSDLSAYAGQEIRLYFGVYNDGVGGSTGIYVDAISLQIMYPPADIVHLPLIAR